MFKRPKWMDFKKFKERRREDAKKLKEYLKGKIIEGTESVFTPKTPKLRDGKKYQRSSSFVRKHRQHRKTKNKMARQSRRINRLRSA